MTDFIIILSLTYNLNFFQSFKKVNYWPCLQIHSLKWNVNLNNCILAVHRYLIILVSTTATFQEEVVTLESFFSLCIVSIIWVVIHRNTVSPRLRNEANYMCLVSSTKWVGPKWWQQHFLGQIVLTSIAAHSTKGQQVAVHMLSGAVLQEARW